MVVAVAVVRVSHTTLILTARTARDDYDDDNDENE